MQSLCRHASRIHALAYTVILEKRIITRRNDEHQRRMEFIVTTVCACTYLCRNSSKNYSRHFTLANYLRAQVIAIYTF